MNSVNELKPSELFKESASLASRRRPYFADKMNNYGLDNRKSSNDNVINRQ